MIHRPGLTIPTNGNGDKEITNPADAGIGIDPNFGNQFNNMS